ncbi:recombinase family protein [Acetobacter tropicalis]|uniref:recombinase family protein n=1 Tax=Acetobacter tropicalis TaxID=104102 RepID=UPI002F909F9F
MLNIQVKTLKQFGCVKIYREKASGADSERLQLEKLIASLGEDDIVVVIRMDRFARSTFDLFSIVKDITNKTVWFR